jgi:GT2 family glycosyltransferase
LKLNTEIIIISYNTADLTIDCINSIKKTTADPGIKITVVDNASSDNTAGEVKKLFPEVKMIENKSNLGYAKAVNIGVGQSAADYLIVCNSDVVFTLNGITALFDFISRKEKIGAAGLRQVYPDGSWQYCYGTVPGLWQSVKEVFYIDYFQMIIQGYKYNHRINIRKPIYPGYIDGAVMCLSKKVFDDVNGFDEDFFFYSEEADFCLRIKKIGYKVALIPLFNVIHLRGGSSRNSGINIKNIDMLIKSKMLFCKKHYGKIECIIVKHLNKLHFRINIFIYSLFSLFLSGNKELENRIEISRIFYSIWKGLKIDE